MKVTKVKEELKQLKTEDLAQKVDTLRREQFSIKLNATTAHLKDYSQFKKCRKNVARALTYLNQRVSK